MNFYQSHQAIKVNYIVAIMIKLLISTEASCTNSGRVILTEENPAIEISHINFPNPLPSSISCEWKIYVPEGANVALKCSDIDLPSSPRCSFSYLRFEEISGQSRKLCQQDTSLKQLKVSALQKLRVKFKYRKKSIMSYKGIKCSIAMTLPSTSGATDIVYPFIESSPQPTELIEPPTSDSNTPECSCGKQSDKRIVGGELASPNEFPWQALLRKTSESTHFCGGSIISINFVLTAAHCVDFLRPRRFKVVVGEHDQLTSDPISREYSVKEIFVHKSWDDNTFKHDIALIKLKSPLELSAEINTVCLPFTKVNTNLSGKNAIVSGWGTTSYQGSISNTLQKVTIPFLTTSECQSDDYVYGDKVTDGMICTYSEGKDACQGDSGGPAVLEVQGISYLMGIVSFGDRCAAINRPGVYTKVTKYLDWIEDITKENFCVT